MSLTAYGDSTMSILKVDTINEKTSGNGVYIPGHVIQTVSKTFQNVTSTTSTSFIDVTGGSLAITPKSTSSKIHVQFNFSLGYYGGNVYQYGSKYLEVQQCLLLALKMVQVILKLDRHTQVFLQ